MGLVKKKGVPLAVTLPLATAVAGGLGFGLGSMGIGGPTSYADITKTPPPPEHGPRPSDLGKYSYSSSNCADGTEVDPITVVFVKDGFPQWIVNHMGHSDWPAVSGGSTQYFLAAPYGRRECSGQDGQTARNTDCGFLPPCTRFHARFMMHRLGGAPRVHPDYGGFASATPHYEKDVWSIQHPTCGHAVADNSTQFQINKITVAGGFNYGREEIKRTWVRRHHNVTPPPPAQPSSHQHPLVDFRNWDNRMAMEQCNGWRAWSDGRVYYIGVKAASL